MVLLVLFVDGRSQHAGGDYSNTDEAERGGKRAARYTEGSFGEGVEDSRFGKLRGAIRHTADTAHGRKHPIRDVLFLSKSCERADAFHQVERAAYEADRAVRRIFGEGGPEGAGLDHPEAVRQVEAFLRQSCR